MARQTNFSNRRNRSLIDPVNILQNAKYINNGLTITSDNTDINKRDENGNIIVEDNRPLIIETNSYRIPNSDMLEILDTRFTYFKFPANTVIEDIPDSNIELDLDPIYARYRPASSNRMPSQIFEGNGIFNGIEFSFIEEGLPQKAANTYYISKEIKNSGVNLRFRIRLVHSYSAASGTGSLFFTIMKNGPSVGGLQRTYKGPFSSNGGNIVAGAKQTVDIDLVIPNWDFEIGDYFQIGAVAGQNNDDQNHVLEAVPSYWVITDANKNVDEWNQPIS